MEIIRIKENELADFKSLIEIFKEVFENDEPVPDNDHLLSLLANLDFMVFAAKLNNQVVGGLTIYILHSYYMKKSTAYIYDVGIASKFQGQGLGKALIADVCEFCKQNGFEDAYVAAEKDDIDAINFYRKTNFVSETNAIHFTYQFNDKK